MNPHMNPLVRLYRRMADIKTELRRARYLPMKSASIGFLSQRQMPASSTGRRVWILPSDHHCVGGPRPCLTRQAVIFRISAGSRMIAMTAMRHPQAGQAQISSSYTLASRRAQALRRCARPTSRSWGAAIESGFRSALRPYQRSGARQLSAGRRFQAGEMNLLALEVSGGGGPPCDGVLILVPMELLHGQRGPHDILHKPWRAFLS